MSTQTANAPAYGPRDFKPRLVPDEGPNAGKPFTTKAIDTLKVTTGGKTNSIKGLDGAVLTVVPGLAEPGFELSFSTSEDGAAWIKHLSGGEGGAYSKRFTAILPAQRRGVNGGNVRTYEVLGCVMEDGGGLDLGADKPPTDSLKAKGSDVTIDGESLYRETGT